MFTSRLKARKIVEIVMDLADISLPVEIPFQTRRIQVCEVHERFKQTCPKLEDRGRQHMDSTLGFLGFKRVIDPSIRQRVIEVEYWALRRALDYVAPGYKDKSEGQAVCDELNSLHHELNQMRLNLNNLWAKHGVDRRVEVTVFEKSTGKNLSKAPWEVTG